MPRVVDRDKVEAYNKEVRDRHMNEYKRKLFKRDQEIKFK
jgi:hypothetical protein